MEYFQASVRQSFGERVSEKSETMIWTPSIIVRQRNLSDTNLKNGISILISFLWWAGLCTLLLSDNIPVNLLCSNERPNSLCDSAGWWGSYLMHFMCFMFIHLIKHLIFVFLSCVALWGLWFPCGCVSIHCKHRHNPPHVHGLHHLLFAWLHQRGQKEKGGKVSANQAVVVI